MKIKLYYCFYILCFFLGVGSTYLMKDFFIFRKKVYNYQDLLCYKEKGEDICLNNKFYPITGIVYKKYPLGSLASKTIYKKGKKEGIEKTYYFSGYLMSEGTYKAGKKEGIERSYYENGILKSENDYKTGILVGNVKEYYENGNLKNQGNYNEGKPEGIFKDYYENGDVKIEGIYKDSKIKKDISSKKKARLKKSDIYDKDLFKKKESQRIRDQKKKDFSQDEKEFYKIYEVIQDSTKTEADKFFEKYLKTNFDH